MPEENAPVPERCNLGVLFFSGSVLVPVQRSHLTWKVDVPGRPGSCSYPASPCHTGSSAQNRAASTPPKWSSQTHPWMPLTLWLTVQGCRTLCCKNQDGRSKKQLVTWHPHWEAERGECMAELNRSHDTHSQEAERDEYMAELSWSHDTWAPNGRGPTAIAFLLPVGPSYRMCSL